MFFKEIEKVDTEEYELKDLGEEQEVRVIKCHYCNKEIKEDDVYLENEAYCSFECYLKELNNEYFD